jgi:hypothetical protein
VNRGSAKWEYTPLQKDTPRHGECCGIVETIALQQRKPQKYYRYKNYPVLNSASVGYSTHRSTDYSMQTIAITYGGTLNTANLGYGVQRYAEYSAKKINLVNGIACVKPFARLMDRSISCNENELVLSSVCMSRC